MNVANGRLRMRTIAAQSGRLQRRSPESRADDDDDDDDGKLRKDSDGGFRRSFSLRPRVRSSSEDWLASEDAEFHGPLHELRMLSFDR